MGLMASEAEEDPLLPPPNSVERRDSAASGFESGSRYCLFLAGGCGGEARIKERDGGVSENVEKTTNNAQDMHIFFRFAVEILVIKSRACKLRLPLLQLAHTDEFSID